MPHPIVEARRQQQSAIAARLFKESLRKEQEELAEAIERSLEMDSVMSDAVTIESDEGTQPTTCCGYFLHPAPCPQHPASSRTPCAPLCAHCAFRRDSF